MDHIHNNQLIKYKKKTLQSGLYKTLLHFE